MQLLAEVLWCIVAVRSQFCLRTLSERPLSEHCGLLGYYAASSGNSLPTFRGNRCVPFSADGTDRLSSNFGNPLPLLAA